VGRLAPRASVTLGRIQAISAGEGPLNNCQKAMLSLEEDCSCENSTSHSLTAPPTCQFQNSILPYSPRFTPTQPTSRSQRISTHHIYGACTTPHTPLTPPYAHPPHPNPPTSYSPRVTPAQPTYRSQRISPHHIYGACTTPHTPPTPPYPQLPHPNLPRPAPYAPHAPHPTHTHPPLTNPTHPTPPTSTLPSRNPRTQ